MKNEQDVNRLGIELARSQQTLVQCTNSPTNGAFPRAQKLGKNSKGH